MLRVVFVFVYPRALPPAPCRFFFFCFHRYRPLPIIFSYITRKRNRLKNHIEDDIDPRKLLLRWMTFFHS